MNARIRSVARVFGRWLPAKDTGSSRARGPIRGLSRAAVAVAPSAAPRPRRSAAAAGSATLAPGNRDFDTGPTPHLHSPLFPWRSGGDVAGDPRSGDRARDQPGFGEGQGPRRGAVVHPAVPRPRRRRQGRRVDHGRRAGAVGHPHRHRLHELRRHAAGPGPRRRQGDQRGDGEGGPAAAVGAGAAVHRRADARDRRARAVQPDQQVHRQLHPGAGVRGDGAALADEQRAVRRKTFLEGPEGRRIDLGLVGEVNSVNARLLQLLVQADSIPCIATIARDDAGGKAERQRGHGRRRGGGGDEGGKARRRLRHPRHPHRRRTTRPPASAT